jgi:hypothetical protein
MLKNIFPILVIPWCFFLNGCALFPTEKTEDLQKQINTLRLENQSLREEYDKKLEQVKTNNDNLSAQVRHLIEEKQRLSAENQEILSRLEQLDNKGRKTAPRKMPATESKEIRVKVLSGDGNIGSARQMARRLEEMGYQVAQVDFATRSNFMHDTVYFSKNAEDEAKRMVSSLGGRTTTREITWSSSFDIIVVTGLSR